SSSVVEPALRATGRTSVDCLKPPVSRAEIQPETEEALELSPRYLNRELSRLDFMQRVLALAEDRSQPLLERVEFLAIFTNHLDEFFQIRVAGLKEQAAAELAATSPDGLGPREQLGAIRARVHDLTAEASTVMRDLRPKLAAAGIRIVDWDDLKPAYREEMRDGFESRIFPVLPPLAVVPPPP